MNLTSPIDIYCERVGGGLFAEPFNLFSNISFFLAAYFSLREFKKKREGAIPTGVLTLHLATYAIGIGSLIFHSIATVWARGVDVSTIIFFIIFYLSYFPDRILRLTAGEKSRIFTALIGFSLFFIFAIGNEKVEGSIFYFGPIATLFLLTFISYRRGFKSFPLLFGAGLLFVASLFCRIIDLKICSQFTYGTHFLWHLLNGGAIYLLLRALI